MGKYPEFLTFRLSPEMKAAIYEKAEQEDRSVGRILRRLIRAWFQENAESAEKTEED